MPNKQYETVDVKLLLNLKRLTRQPFHIANLHLLISMITCSKRLINTILISCPILHKLYINTTKIIYFVLQSKYNINYFSHLIFNIGGVPRPKKPFPNYTYFILFKYFGISVLKYLIIYILIYLSIHLFIAFYKTSKISPAEKTKTKS